LTNLTQTRKDIARILPTYTKLLHVSFNDIIEIHDNISLTDTEINNKKHNNITNSKNNEN